ncbi:hypothetical protein LSH36_883g00002, partial [Paralvinella palmiformis]
CQPCAELASFNSRFMKKCGTHMDRTEINQLMSTYQKIKCDPVELGCLKRDLEIICERKTNITFGFPQCGCEECWLLFQTDSDFMKKCGSGMSCAMLINPMKICYANLDSLDHFMAFVDNLGIICHEKGNGYLKKESCFTILLTHIMEVIFVLVLFESIADVAFSIKSSCPPRPSLTHPSNDGIGDTECEPCAQLAAFNSQFMKICGPHLDKQSLSERLYTCRQKEKDPVQLWLFYQDLKSECYSLTGQNITLPICGCDVCWKLLDESSEFMKTCGTSMDRREINQLMSTCEKIKCDPVEIGCFKRDLELICERKMNSTFEFPQCG